MGPFAVSPSAALEEMEMPRLEFQLFSGVPASAPPFPCLLGWAAVPLLPLCPPTTQTQRPLPAASSPSLSLSPLPPGSVWGLPSCPPPHAGVTTPSLAVFQSEVKQAQDRLLAVSPSSSGPGTQVTPASPPL